MASSGTEEEGDRKLLVAIYHPLAPHAERLHDAIEAAGYKAHILPPHVNGLRPWLDICFILLLINPFLDWQEPFEFVRLASMLAGQRPVIVVSDRDSVDERTGALEIGRGAWRDRVGRCV